MEIKYCGESADYETRCALIAYDDENEKEVRLAERIANYLEKVLSYNVNQACNGLYIIVVEDKKEYVVLANEYKKAKKCFTRCAKAIRMCIIQMMKNIFSLIPMRKPSQS